MLDKVDKCLAVSVVSLNFFMMGMLESSLYTILPKYLSTNATNATNASDFISNSTKTIPSENCYLMKPPYVIVSLIFLAKSIAQLFINSIIGCVMDKINNFFILFISHGVGIVISIIYAFGNSVLLYVFGRILDAFVSSAIFIALLSIISKIFTNLNIRGRYFGLANIFYFFSHSVGPAYAAEIDNNFGKTVVFLSFIPPWCICGILTFLQYYKVKRGEKTCKNSPEKLITQESELPIEKCEEINNIPSDEHKKLNTEETTLCADMGDPEVTSKKITSTKISNKKKFKPILLLKMLKDPFVLACLAQLFIINLSMFSLPPTLPSWMGYKLCSNEVQQGLVWSFGFLGYLCGVSLMVLILLYIPKIRLFSTVFGHIVVGILLVALPFTRDWKLIFIPIIGMYFSVGIVEQVIFPLTTFLADSRFQSHHGTMSSLTSQSLSTCATISTLLCGYIADKLGFHILSISLGVINIVFSPIALIHRKILSE